MERSSIDALGPLLGVLRAHPALEESRTCEFQLDGRDFIHFHEGPSGLFADVLLVKGRVHMPVRTPAEQAELLERIDLVLESLERRRSHRKRTQRGPRS